jgi:methionyl-tRNA synthetase
MSEKSLIYVTTTLPYVNAEPHIGFAFELVSADIYARAKHLQGHEVFFNTGTDEHGLKIYRRALEVKEKPQIFVDVLADKFKQLVATLHVWPAVNFIRTTNPRHERAAAAFWRRCQERGFIYKAYYRVKYCVGCELEKTESELERGRCPIHPNLELEVINEENYFFKFSAFNDFLLNLYVARPDFVVPVRRLNEVKSFVSRGLEDFSISRLAAKQPWGIPVPDDPDQTMYVWFDALVNYVSAVGWPEDEEKFDRWWRQSGGVIQFAGKDNLRQQASMWQAMLHAAGLPSSKQIVIHGFITSGGEKMSKSRGNIIDPFILAGEYGADAVRYYLARHIHPFEDSDFKLEKFKEAYNANLANGLGNLVSRVLTMANKNGVKLAEKREIFDPHYTEALDKFEINKAADIVWEKISAADEFIQQEEPFKKIKTNPAEAKKDIAELLARLHEIAFHLSPLLPQTAENIRNLVSKSAIPETPLFPRKE